MLRFPDIAPNHPPEGLFNASLTKGPSKPSASGTQYTEGTKAFSEDDQLAFYSSGRVAVCVNERSAGKYVTAYDDTEDGSPGKCLLSFDAYGCGSCVRAKTGRPWLTVDSKGATLFREDGSIERAMLWTCPPWHKGMEDPPSAVKPCFLRLNQRLALDFKDRVHNTLIFFCEGEFKYQVGWRLKREHRYTEISEGVIKNGPKRGGHIVSMPSRYEEASDMVGVKARIARAKAPPAGKVPGVVDIVDRNKELAHYLETTETMIVSPAVLPTEYNRAIRSMFPVAQAGTNPAQERLIAETILESRKRTAKPALHTMACSRRRLPELRSKMYAEAITMCADLGQLLCVCVLGDWVAESTRMEKAAEEVNATLWQVYEHKKSSPMDKQPPIKGVVAADGGKNLPYRIVRYNPTKDTMLRTKHAINRVPIFIYYMDGKLLGMSPFWNGFGKTRQDFFIELQKQKENGARGLYIDENYQLPGPGLHS